MWVDPTLRPRLFGVIIGRMENGRKKNKKKVMFVIVWLRVKKGRDFSGA